MRNTGIKEELAIQFHVSLFRNPSVSYLHSQSIGKRYPVQPSSDVLYVPKGATL